MASRAHLLLIYVRHLQDLLSIQLQVTVQLSFCHCITMITFLLVSNKMLSLSDVPLMFVFLPIFNSRQFSIFLLSCASNFFSASAIQSQSHLQIFGVYYSYTHFLEPKSVLFPLAEHFLQSQDQSEKVCGLRNLL